MYVCQHIRTLCIRMIHSFRTSAQLMELHAYRFVPVGLACRSIQHSCSLCFYRNRSRIYWAKTYMFSAELGEWFRESTAHCCLRRQLICHTSGMSNDRRVMPTQQVFCTVANFYNSHSIDFIGEEDFSARVGRSKSMKGQTSGGLCTRTSFTDERS